MLEKQVPQIAPYWILQIGHTRNKTIAGADGGCGTRVAVSTQGGGSFTLDSTNNNTGVTAHLLRRKTKGTLGLRGLRAEPRAWAEGPWRREPATAPAAEFNLDFFLPASGTGGKLSRWES